MRNPLLADARVRKAFTLAINRNEMLNSFFNGQGTVISGPFAPGSWAYNLDVKPLPYDPAEAEKLLSQAGFRKGGDGVMTKGGKRLELSLKVPIAQESEAVKRVVLAFKNYLGKAGAQINVEFMEWQAWKEAVFLANDFDIMFASWVFDDSADISSLFHSAEIGAWRNNFGGYSNRDVDALLVEAKLTLDHEKRRTIYRRLHEMLAEENPYTFLWTLTNYSGYHKKVRGVQIHPYKFFSYADSWYIADGEGDTAAGQGQGNPRAPARAARGPEAGGDSGKFMQVKWAALRPVSVVLARELAVTAALLLGVSLVAFLILYLAPGDPFAALLGGRNLSEAERAAAYEALGIPHTWYGQYLAWVGKLLHGDLGVSLRSGQPVTREIAASGGYTLALTLGSLLVTLLVAVPIAVYAALQPGGRRAWPLTMGVYVISALPTFWLGYLVIYFFTHQARAVPDPLRGRRPAGVFVAVRAAAACCVLGLGQRHALRRWCATLREEVARVLGEEYVRTAACQGRLAVAARVQGGSAAAGGRDRGRENAASCSAARSSSSRCSTGRASGGSPGRRPRTATSR
ncbi:MAG: ABC transporter substrate-binding protein [Chromatiales bacterium]|nr:ABC transporter substrate-binding protein [Chromatiales bacterium]